jgi:hypothetical protein
MIALEEQARAVPGRTPRERETSPWHDTLLHIGMCWLDSRRPRTPPRKPMHKATRRDAGISAGAP